MFYCPQVSISFSFLAVITFLVKASRTDGPTNRQTYGWMDGWTDGRTDRRTDGQTDRRTDGPTDKASYRDAWTHLKTWKVWSSFQAKGTTIRRPTVTVESITYFGSWVTLWSIQYNKTQSRVPNSTQLMSGIRPCLPMNVDSAMTNPRHRHRLRHC